MSSELALLCAKSSVDVPPGGGGAGATASVAPGGQFVMGRCRNGSSIENSVAWRPRCRGTGQPRPGVLRTVHCALCAAPCCALCAVPCACWCCTWRAVHRRALCAVCCAPCPVHCAVRAFGHRCALCAVPCAAHCVAAVRCATWAVPCAACAMLCDSCASTPACPTRPACPVGGRIAMGGGGGGDHLTWVNSAAEMLPKTSRSPGAAPR